MPIVKGVYTFLSSGRTVRGLYSQPPPSIVAMSCFVWVTPDLDYQTAGTVKSDVPANESVLCFCPGEQIIIALI